MSQSSFETRRDDARRLAEEQEVRDALLQRRSPLGEEPDDEVTSA